MKAIKDKLFDPAYLTYLSLLLINLIIYWFTETYHPLPGKALPIFCLHYASAAIAMAMYFTLKRDRREGVFSVILLLFTISCYALNREVELFDESTGWFNALLLTVSANLLLVRYREYFPRPLQYVNSFLLGVAALVYGYLAVYLLPIYPVSIPALIALGLSVHTFIPLILTVHVVLIIRKQIPAAGNRWLFAAGMALPLAVVIGFTVRFNEETTRLNRIFNRQLANSNDLPAWVEAAMRVRKGMVTDRVLKSGFTYRQPFSLDRPFFIPERRMNEPMVHDPLVTVAMCFSPDLQLDEESRIQLLDTRFNARHATQERLWGGDHLKTMYVNTRVQIWPKLHVSYTEKLISVSNTSAQRREEAIYTFQLPEGGVVTSLSLWINGKEEKSILTTREKADSAYRTIVGVEKRDPSLVRWQEGNTVSVRVFPVDGRQTRQFKIGFTAPLAANGKQLVYRNSPFKGPHVKNVPEDVAVEFMTTPVNPAAPAYFRRAGDFYTSDQDYQPEWHITCHDEGFHNASFSFNGYEYTLKPYAMLRTPVVTDAVYLDVNASWTMAECEQIIKMAGGRPVYVWNGQQMVRAGKGSLETPLQFNFSLFPVHRIPNPATALLITKSTGISPHLGELEGSDFKKGLARWLAQPEQLKVRLLDIGTELSPYLKTLKEQRVFRYEKGGLLLVKVLLDSGQFAADIESPSQVVIDDANLVIEKKAGMVQNNAPDHLMRLFAYNHIMQQKGRGAMPDSLVALAQEAYVVTPLTSLVVLETQKDYDRFGIKDSGNSLKNASAKGEGAVPEPHEWALIILVIVTLLYVKFKPAWNRSNA